MSSVIAFTVDGTAKPTAVSASNPLPVTASGGGTGGAMKVEGVNASGGAASNPILIGYNQSGTVVQVNGASGAMAVGGNVASGATDSGNPVKIGGRYNATRPVLTDGQRCDMQMDNRGNIAVNILARDGTNAAAVTSGANDGVSIVYGALVTTPYNLVYNGSTWDRQRGSAGEGVIVRPYAFGAQTRQVVAAALTTGPTALFAAAGANTRNMLTSLTISQDTGASSNTVKIQDGSSTIWQVEIPAGAYTEHFTFPAPLRGSANTTMTVELSGAGPLTISAQGYTVVE